MNVECDDGLGVNLLLEAAKGNVLGRCLGGGAAVDAMEDDEGILGDFFLAESFEHEADGIIYRDGHGGVDGVEREIEKEEGAGFSFDEGAVFTAEGLGEVLFPGCLVGAAEKRDAVAAVGFEVGEAAEKAEAAFERVELRPIAKMAFADHAGRAAGSAETVGDAGFSKRRAKIGTASPAGPGFNSWPKRCWSRPVIRPARVALQTGQET